MSITVVIPIHNAENTIVRSLRSILNQTYKNEIEVLCILNCCTDNTSSIIETMLSMIGQETFKNIEFKILECNEKGIVPALNHGLLNSKYHLIARLDADDVWYPEKLQKQVEFLEKNKEVDILGTQMRLVDKNGNPTGNFTKNPLNNEEIKFNLLNGHNTIAHPSVIFKKEILLRTGMYDDFFPIAEDLGLWLKAIKWYNFANLDEVLVDYTSVHNPKYNPLVPQFAASLMSNILEFHKEIGY